MSSSDGEEPVIDIAAVAQEFHRTVVEATPSWVRRCVIEVTTSQRIEMPDDFDDMMDQASARAARFIDVRLGALLDTDIDRQQSTPLAVIREAVRFPVEVLHQLGASQVHRLDMERWAFPNDPFGLTPANLADLDQSVHQAGLIWGATKAGLHLQRRRAEGLL